MTDTNKPTPEAIAFLRAKMEQDEIARETPQTLLEARERDYAQAAAIAYFGKSRRIAVAIQRAVKLPPGPPLGPEAMIELFDGAQPQPDSFVDTVADVTVKLKLLYMDAGLGLKTGRDALAALNEQIKRLDDACNSVMGDGDED